MTSVLLPPITPAVLNAPTVYHADSGLTIIAEQLPIEAVNLNIWLNVGSAIEPDPINGIAHFLEHMVFKGTPDLAIGEFERRIEACGAMTNAATSQDYTHYYFTSAPQDFARLAPLQWDVVLNPSFEPGAFTREAQVVLEEIRRSSDSPSRRNFQRMTDLAFQSSPYRRPVLGSEAIIAGLQPEQMRSFHQTWYQPSAMTAVAVGNLPVEALLDITLRSFEQAYARSSDQSSHRSPDPVPNCASGQALPSSLSSHSPAAQPPTFQPELPFTQIERQDYVDPALQQARLVMLWRVPGLDAIEQTYALDVLASILGQGRTGRLVRDLREERGLVSGIGAGNLSYRMQGLFQVYAQLPEEHLETVEAAIVEAIATVRTHFVEPSELERVRVQTANRFVFSNERPSDRANLYGYFHTLCGDLSVGLNYPDAIRAVSARDVQTAAQHYLHENAYGVVTVRPGEGDGLQPSGSC